MSTHIGSSQEILMETKSPIKKVVMVCAILSTVGVFCLIVGLSVVGSDLNGLTQTVNEELIKPTKPTETGRKLCTTVVCLETAGHLNTTVDLTVDPCQDFFNFSCGKFIKGSNRPDDQSRWGQFDFLRKELKEDINGLLDGENETYYNNFFNQAIQLRKQCNDKQEIANLTEKLTAVYPKSEGLFPSLDGKLDSVELVTYIKNSIGYSGNGLLNLFVTKRLDGESNSLYIDQPSLGLPKDLYLDTKPNQRVQAYKKFMEDLSNAVSPKQTTEEQKKKLDELFEFEKRLAEISVPEDEHRDDDKIQTIKKETAILEIKLDKEDNPEEIKLEDLLKDLLGANKVEDPVYVVTMPYFTNLMKEKLTSNTLLNYFSWVFLKRYGPYINDDQVNKAFNDYEMAVKGTKEPTARSDFCSSTVTDIYGMAISSEYVPLKFDKQAKKEMLDMVDNLKISFKKMLNQSDWMERNTVKASYAKVDRMISHIGYPDELFDVEGPSDSYLKDLYSYIDKDGQETSIEIKATFLDSMVASLTFLTKQDLLKQGKTSKRSEWIAHPSIVNAFYSPQHNSITFPAGILQSPFYKYGRPGYMNYGAIGSVIGHEITHGFDDQGRMRDALGNKVSWWSDNDVKKYKEKVECFVTQYNNVVYPVGEGMTDVHINGQNTLGENIADNGGILEAFLAYQQYKQGIQESALPGFESLSDEQMFFISYAQNWCEDITNNAIYQQLLTDPHSPADSRVNVVVKNTPQFYEAFNCPKPPAASMCKLW